MPTVNIHEAKTRLSQLVAAAEAGEVVIIARNGLPVAQLVAYTPPARQPGRLKGKMVLHEDFDAPLPADLQAAFEDEPV
jgi:prevent-host-death family protein